MPTRMAQAESTFRGLIIESVLQDLFVWILGGLRLRFYVCNLVMFQGDNPKSFFVRK